MSIPTVQWDRLQPNSGVIVSVSSTFKQWRKLCTLAVVMETGWPDALRKCQFHSGFRHFQPRPQYQPHPMLRLTIQNCTQGYRMCSHCVSDRRSNSKIPKSGEGLRPFEPRLRGGQPPLRNPSVCTFEWGRRREKWPLFLSTFKFVKCKKPGSCKLFLMSYGFKGRGWSLWRIYASMVIKGLMQ